MPNEDPITGFKSNQVARTLLSSMANISTQVAEINSRLKNLEKEISAVKADIERIVNAGFVDGNLQKHKKWHERGWLCKILFRQSSDTQK